MQRHQSALLGSRTYLYRSRSCIGSAMHGRAAMNW